METANNPQASDKAPERRIIRDRTETGNFLAMLAETARREIVIFAPGLDGAYFNNARFARALASFAARHRQNLARIVTEDVEQAMRDNDRLVGLCRRLSDFIHLHQVGEEHLGIREMFMVVDHHGYLHQPDTAKPDCVAHSHDGHEAVELTRRFNELWGRSEPIPALRAAGL